MSIKHRLAKLEGKHRTEVQAADVFTVRHVDYRADISPGVEAAPDSIPVKFVDMKPREGECQ